jgi:hypothetical protein
MLTLKINYDSDTECPCDWNDQWKLVSFNDRHSNYQNPSEFIDSIKNGEIYWNHVGLKRKIDTGTAFVLSYYEHGGSLWSLKGEGPQCRFDTAQIAGILLWEHPVNHLGPKMYEDRKEDARQFLNVYNAWANGECYFFSLESETSSLDSCGGFIGDEGLKEMLKLIKESLADSEDKEIKIVGNAAQIIEGVDFGLKMVETSP